MKAINFLIITVFSFFLISVFSKSTVSSVVSDNLSKEEISNSPYITSLNPQQFTTWGYEAHCFDIAHNYGFKGQDVKVGIVDSGYMSHSNISALRGDTGLIFSNSFHTSKNDTHALSVASIIGANGKSGLVGLAPGVELSFYEAVDGDTGSIFSVLNALEKAVDDKNDVINVSVIPTVTNTMMLKYFNQKLERILNKAEQNGTIIVASTGNEGAFANAENISILAKNPRVIGVGSIDDFGVISYFSSVGDGIDFVAAGENIVVATDNDSYKLNNGTSFAAPHITAMIAIIKQLNPKIGVEEARQILKDSAISLGVGGYDQFYGYGFPTFENFDFGKITVTPQMR